MSKRILVSNDDGIEAKGLHALVEAVAPLGEVVVVAPLTEQSATSHALSLHRPLRVKQHSSANWFSVDGTPADCVYLAMVHLLRERKPDIVISGINHGPNLADDVIYSGTVAAAMEGALLGAPAIAFSLASRHTADFQHTLPFIRQVVKTALSGGLKPKQLVNVNLPPDSIKGYQVTRLGSHSYGTEVHEKEDPRGRKYYWIGGNGYAHDSEPGTDVTCVHEHQMASLTPLMFDLTDTSSLEPLKAWSLEGF
jgi:5'-nucleotidase